MNTAYLSLGSNVGNRLEWLQKAMGVLDVTCGKILRHSAVYETEAWGLNNQDAFLNAVVQLQTTLAPAELLTGILFAEKSLGRIRTEKWGPRIIDIDILLYNNLVKEVPGLIIPHPYLQERRFALVPLAEIAGDLEHPVFRKTMSELLQVCPDHLHVTTYKEQLFFPV